MFILESMFAEHQYEITAQTFPDGSLRLQLPKDDSIRSVIWHYENDAELFTLQCIRDFYPQPLILELPYIPNARQDRVKNPEDVFTLKTFCRIINAMNFINVIVRDAHSNVSLALLDRVIQEPINHRINAAIRDINSTDLLAFYPDEGAMKRYSSDVGLPYAFGIKKRNWETGKIEGLQIMNDELVRGRDILIIDDICSYGGTFYHSAKALKEAGAKNIYLYVTHCENNVFKGDMYNMPEITRIYTSDERIHWEEDTLMKIIPV